MYQFLFTYSIFIFTLLSQIISSPTLKAWIGVGEKSISGGSSSIYFHKFSGKLYFSEKFILSNLIYSL